MKIEPLEFIRMAQENEIFPDSLHVAGNILTNKNIEISFLPKNMYVDGVFNLIYFINLECFPENLEVSKYLIMNDSKLINSLKKDYTWANSKKISNHDLKEWCHINNISYTNYIYRYYIGYGYFIPNDYAVSFKLKWF